MTDHTLHCCLTGCQGEEVKWRHHIHRASKGWRWWRRGQRCQQEMYELMKTLYWFPPHLIVSHLFWLPHIPPMEPNAGQNYTDLVTESNTTISLPMNGCEGKQMSKCVYLLQWCGVFMFLTLTNAWTLSALNWSFVMCVDYLEGGWRAVFVSYFSSST